MLIHMGPGFGHFLALSIETSSVELPAVLAINGVIYKGMNMVISVLFPRNYYSTQCKL